MHATKVGLVGQTFALAKNNDSGGRKSRIRRSKDERKTLVESFIKKYQNSNNGNFPSLNLTHKEVGGSFYTVREIVREIIQENRVLGPAKLTEEEEYASIFSEQHPLGSISVELQTPLVPPNEAQTATHILPNHHQYTNEEQVLDSSDHHAAKCQHWRIDHRKFLYRINKAGQRNEDSEALYAESQVVLDGGKDVEEIVEASKAKMSQIITDVVVETFPLRPISERIFDFDGKSVDQPVLTGTFLKEKEIESMKLETGNGNSLPRRTDFVGNSFGSVDEKADSSLGSPICSITNQESISLSADDCTDLEVKDRLPAGIGSIDASNGIHTENLNSTNTSNSHMRSISNESKLDIQLGGSSQNGSNPLLDRINLESWEATSKKPVGPETNPLLAYFKAFATAFVKFWSE